MGLSYDVEVENILPSCKCCVTARWLVSCEPKCR